MSVKDSNGMQKTDEAMSASSAQGSQLRSSAKVNYRILRSLWQVRFFVSSVFFIAFITSLYQNPDVIGVQTSSKKLDTEQLAEKDDTKFEKTKKNEASQSNTVVKSETKSGSLISSTNQESIISEPSQANQLQTVSEEDVESYQKEIFEEALQMAKKGIESPFERTSHLALTIPIKVSKFDYFEKPETVSKQANFYAGLTASYLNSSIQMKHLNVSTFLEERNGAEYALLNRRTIENVSRLTMSLNASFGYQFKNGLAIETGVHLTRFEGRQMEELRMERQYTHFATKTFPLPGDGNKSYSMREQVILAHEIVDTIISDFSYQTISLPLAVQYHFQLKKWNMFVSAGTSITLFNHYNQNVYSQKFPERNYSYSGYQHMMRLQANYFVSTGLEYELVPNMYLRAEPSYRFTFNQGQNRYVLNNFSNFGMGVGARFKF